MWPLGAEVAQAKYIGSGVKHLGNLTQVSCPTLKLKCQSGVRLCMVQWICLCPDMRLSWDLIANPK